MCTVVATRMPATTGDPLTRSGRLAALPGVLRLLHHVCVRICDNTRPWRPLPLAPAIAKMGGLQLDQDSHRAGLVNI